MLKNWIQILPLFLIKIIARKQCQIVEHGGRKYCMAFPDVLIAMPVRRRAPN